jgi:hypothetical protein
MDWNGTGKDKSRFRFVGCLEFQSCTGIACFKNVNNGSESVVYKSLDGSTYPG